MIEPQTDEERQAGSDAGVSHVQPVMPGPPLQHHEQNQQRHAILRERDHDRVERGTFARGRIDPLRNSIIHRVCLLQIGQADLPRPIVSTDAAGRVCIRAK